MNNWYFFGILCFLQVFISFEKEIKGSPGEIKFLCTIFPEILKEKCLEYNENEFENKINIKVHSEMEITTTFKSVRCDLCKQFIQEIIKKIGKDRSEDVIRKALEKACDNVPPYLQQPCKMILRRFEDKLVDMIMNNIPVDQICHGIELCNSNDIQNFQKIKSIQCTICKKVVEEIFRRIGNKRTEDAIKNALRGICDIFPVQLRQECQNLMNSIANSIVKLIMNNAGPDMICSVLQMCFKDQIQSYNEIQSIQCQFCKKIVQEVLQRFGNKQTEKEIIKVLQSMCVMLPLPVRKDCLNIVNVIVSSIIKLIMNKEAPDMVCRLLQMCFKGQIQTYSNDFTPNDSLYFLPKLNQM